ncbi:MAG: S1C family serine protease [Ruminococcus sp.]
MSDYYNDNNDFSSGNNPSENQNTNSNDVYSSSDRASSESKATESSYEWNSNSSQTNSNGEYHYSYVNGNNENASHNPNNYESAYSTPNPANTTSDSSDSQNTYSSSYTNTGYSGYSSGYGSNASYGTSGTYNSQSPYGSYSNTAGQPVSPYGHQQNTHKVKPKKQKVKKPKKPASRGFVAAMLIVSILCSAALGFGGGYLANNMNKSSSGSININKVEASNTSSSGNASANTTSDIVKKTADSVVEIATEGVKTGSFAQQYVVQGAGSGVIISEDGYIITNNHVIEDANSVTVTLRDGKTSYTAAVIGSDSENDIALLKVDATGLTPATFGDSSSLAVGDYVVAIGNPLGELGGTVTDGIISALARDVTIEGENMTLLQTNAQISPGNSGGGLFNANGELIGIVNAKDSATEVEGIAFAIPINNVLDIIDDLKSYGYVTGKIDLGMQLTDITSKDTAFYYGVNQTGCYVLSVTRGSNAEEAGFHTGDLITKVNGTSVSTSSDVENALENSKVGDNVKFTIYRNGTTADLTLTLAEYVPSGNAQKQSSTTPANDSSDDIWSQMFGW